jgi:hypothetical protein
VTTSREYRQFARKCIKWAAEATTDEARNSFLHLAGDWIFAALAVDRFEKEEVRATRWRGRSAISFAMLSSKQHLAGRHDTLIAPQPRGGEGGLNTGLSLVRRGC